VVEWKASIVVSTRPGIGVGNYAVYFLTGSRVSRQGVVRVQLNPEVVSACTDPRAIAELSALHYLLHELDALGQGRTGAGVLITLSVKAVREAALISKLPRHALDKLIREAAGKKYIPGTKMTLSDYKAIVPYMRALLTRFGDAHLECTGDATWIQPVIPEERTHEIEVDGPPLGRINMFNVGDVAVSYHAFRRFCQRGNSDQGEAWKALCRIFADPMLKRVDVPEDVKAKTLKKYGQVGEVYYHPITEWQFVVAINKKSNVRHVLTCFHAYAGVRNQ